MFRIHPLSATNGPTKQQSEWLKHVKANLLSHGTYMHLPSANRFLPFLVEAPILLCLSLVFSRTSNNHKNINRHSYKAWSFWKFPATTWCLPGASSSSEKPTRGHARVQPCQQNLHDSTSMRSQAQASEVVISFTVRISKWSLWMLRVQVFRTNICTAAFQHFKRKQ